MVTRNDPGLGLFNGDIGLVLKAPDGTLKACFAAGERLHAVSVTRLADVQTAWALTVHKSQGSEFGHVLLVLPDEDSPVLTRELLYTGITRARRALTLVAPRPALVATAAARPTRRFSGLAQALAAPG
jgi:exodeoxyribonuclease V alpha subunit